MGNDNSSNSGSGSSGSSQPTCTGANAPGLNQVCYTEGAAQAKGNASPDIVGEALTAGVCSTNSDANFCYGMGASDNSWGGSRWDN